MRYDLDGDGAPDAGVAAADQTTYTNLFVCPPTTAECFGYELMADISLASYKNTWTRIGGSWQAVFDGNGFSITDLEGQHGLFDHIGAGGNDDVNAKTVVKNVDLVGAKITLAANRGGGALAQVNHATIIGSYVTGEITANATEKGVDFGGLVGWNKGMIAASVVDVDVKVTNISVNKIARLGAFSGMNYGKIYRSYAYGNIIDARTRDARAAATRPNSFHAFGFVVNHGQKGGTIDSSLSYGDKIVTEGDGENAIVASRSPAKFTTTPRTSPLITDSCALDDESEFTCPPLTPTPTPAD